MKKLTKKQEAAKAKSERFRALNALRETLGGGRPKKLRKCPFCKQKKGVRELRLHKPICPKKVVSNG